MTQDWLKALKCLPESSLPKTDRILDIIIRGYDKGEPALKRVYWSYEHQLFLVADLTDQHFYPIGQWTIADYWLEKFQHQFAEMDIRELKKLATFAILQSSYFQSVGGPIK